MGVSGNFAKLRSFAQSLRNVAGTSGLVALNRNLAEAAVELVKDGFEKQSDPHGSKWKPTLRGGAILQDTGRLRNSFAVKSVTPHGFLVTGSATYGVYHQTGTSRMPARKMPARKMVPDSSMPAAWLTELETVAETYLKSKIKT